MNELVTTPITSDPAFARLPAEEKANVLAKEEAMRYIDAARNVCRACKELETRCGHTAGWSKVRLRSQYYIWRQAGRSWRTLANFSKSTRECWSRKFQDHYKKYCEENQRAARPAYRRMLIDLRRGKSFEGIGTWKDVWCAEYGKEHAPEFCPAGWVPPGMSYRNMQNQAKLTTYEKTANRIGQRAAKAFIPPVWTTRIGLLPGRVLMADDVHHDAKVNVCDINDRAMRPLEFAILDVASAVRAASYMKPEVMREDGTVERLSTRRDFKVVVADYLVNCGHRDDDQGTTLIGEHGTAALNDHDRKALEQATGNKFHFDAGAVEKCPAHKGMFGPQGRGNFRIKGLLEGGGGHLLTHNMMAHIEGQVGSNSRTCEVEELAGRDSYNKTILKAIARFPENKQKLFFHVFKPWLIYNEIYLEIRNEIDNRRDHDMEGWEQNGWIAVEWRAGESSGWMPWEAIDDLPPEQAALCRQLAETPGNMRTVRMSPREVWRRHQHELRRLPLWGLVDFLGKDFRREVKVGKHGEFAFDDIHLGPGTHRYMAVIQQPDGRAARLPPGREYDLMILPSDLTRSVVIDRDGGEVLGVATRVTNVDRCNARAIELAQELQRVHIAALNAPIKERHQDAAAVLQGGIAANTALLADMASAEDIPFIGSDPESDADSDDASEKALSMLEEVHN
ncbi:MAG: hypothetical protein ACOYOU_16255 [Kiritimatiellia bacterium]